MRHAVVSVALAVGLLGTGCLDSTYRVPRASLLELAQTPPERRGDNLRVIQGVGGSDDDVPSAPRVDDSDTHVGVFFVAPIGPGPVGRGGGIGGGRPSNVASNAKQDAKAWFVVAAITAAALAGTEGARFDGWARVHPMMPLHLRLRGGGYTWVPLAHLTPDLAYAADKAVVRESEGPFTRLGRAPLDREGFSYALLLGARGVPSWNGDDDLGSGGHIQLGVYPLHWLGVMADIGMAWRRNELEESVYYSHVGLELRAMPLQVGPLSFGGFGQIGSAKRLEDGPNARDHSAMETQLGGVVELELTTRMTLIGRLGRTFWDEREVDEGVIGLAIY